MLQMHPDHQITVTGGGPFGRAYVDCSCGMPAVIAATKFAAQRAAFRHHHDVMGCNCPPSAVAHGSHPDPGPDAPSPVSGPVAASTTGSSITTPN